ncbi:hypothetical protein V6Z12_D11G030000 [Gossypium hirsutum]
MKTSKSMQHCTRELLKFKSFIRVTIFPQVVDRFPWQTHAPKYTTHPWIHVLNQVHTSLHIPP